MSLADKTVPELRKLAKSKGHTGYSRLTKQALVDLLTPAKKVATKKPAAAKAKASAKPKPPMNAYMHYANAYRDAVRAELGEGATIGQVGKEIAARWAKVKDTPAAKKFHDAAAIQKAAYAAAKKSAAKSPAKKAAAKKSAAKKAAAKKAAAKSPAKKAAAKPKAKSPAKKPAAKALETKTVAELRQLAKSKGHTGYSRLTKQALIDMLSKPKASVAAKPKAVAKKTVKAMSPPKPQPVRRPEMLPEPMRFSKFEPERPPRPPQARMYEAPPDLSRPLRTDVPLPITRRGPRAMPAPVRPRPQRQTSKSERPPRPPRARMYEASPDLPEASLTYEEAEIFKEALEEIAESPARESTPQVKPSRVPTAMDISVHSEKGTRDYQEDTTWVYSKDGKIPVMFAVYDGHGGDEVSNLLKAEFAAQVVHELKTNPDVEDALDDAFILYDQYLSKQSLRSGSTAIVVIKIGANLWFANLGDSRAILIRNGKVVHQTKDHKPNDPEERARVEKAGGIVAPHPRGGPPRVNGQIAVSRAFGDMEFKMTDKSSEYNGEDGFVSAVPDVTSHNVLAGDRLVVASDGLWDVFTPQEVAQQSQQSQAVKAITLVRMALAKGSRDNVSAIVVDFS